MRIYTNPMEMVKEVERDLFEMGIDVPSHSVQDIKTEGNTDYTMRELTGYGYTLTSFSEAALEKMILHTQGNYEWCKSEIIDRVSEALQNPGTSWKLDAQLWEKYLDPDGKFSYTYNERLRDQLPNIIHELRRRPNTRQAVITMYDKHQDMSNWGGQKRIPCSLTYQFLYRNNQLNCTYIMRSCDFLKHFTSDVYLTIGLLWYIAEMTDMKPGFFTHFIGSLHAFKVDLAKRGIF